MKSRAYFLITPQNTLTELVKQINFDSDSVNVLLEPALLSGLVGGRSMYDKIDELNKFKIRYALYFITEYEDKLDIDSLINLLLSKMNVSNIDDQWFDQWWNISEIDNYIDINDSPKTISEDLRRAIAPSYQSKIDYLMS